MKRILLFGIIAVVAAPIYARPNGNSRSAPMHVQRSTIARASNVNVARNFSPARNFSSVRNTNIERNANIIRNSNTLRNNNAFRNSNVARNFNTARNVNANRFAANHHHRTRIIYVNYGGWGGYGWGWPYWDYYPYYYGYGPSISFNFSGDDYSYDPYMNNYGYGSNSYGNYYSPNQQQPAYRDGEYNVGNSSIVSKVQEQLRHDGYYKGDVDGALGSRTKYAIRAYQRDHGLEASGTVDEELLRTMGLR